MPRGDHRDGCCNKPNQPCQRIGAFRPNRKKDNDVNEKPNPKLQARIKEWESIPHVVDAKNRHDGNGNTFRKPGSMKRKR